MNWDLIIIRYGEIALKAKYTRNYFENKLIGNIKKTFKQNKISNNIIKEWGRLYLETNDIDNSIKILKKIFGIVSISPAIKNKTDLNEVSHSVCDIAKKILTKNNSFALRVNRVGNHEFTSQDVAIKIGNDIVEKTKSKVNLSFPDFEIYIDIRYKDTYIFLKKIEGAGGMPVGTQGNILAIIDDKKSILSAWYLLKRGCKVIFYIKKSNLEGYLISFCDKWFIDKNIYVDKNKKEENLEILDYIQKKNCHAILTGDRISNKSNNITNIFELKKSFKLPILSPLIVMNDDEIVEKLKFIGL